MGNPMQKPVPICERDWQLKSPIAEAAAILCDQYRKCGAAFLAAETVYAIPADALVALRRSPFFSGLQIDAEEAFTSECTKAQAVGVRGNHAIFYPSLWNHTPRPDSAHAQGSAQYRQDTQAIRGARPELVAAHVRQLGAAGYFVTNPMFLREVGALWEHYRAFPETGGPGFPLRRTSRLPEPADDSFLTAIGASVVDDETVESDRIARSMMPEFSVRLVAFLDRWGLESLADWYLPVPGAALTPNWLPPGAPADPAHGPPNFHPAARG